MFPDGSSSTGSSLNATALDLLFRRYAPALSRFFERRVGRKEEVPDLVQDVFLRLAKLRDLSNIEQPEHYLFRTASSALRDRARRDAVRSKALHEGFDDLRHGTSALSPETILHWSQAVGRMTQELRMMPTRSRDVFTLRALEGWKMDEVAQAMGISKRAAEKHYARAMARLGQTLSDYRDD
jgi:RNA polymerase sigma factor (sigma-70 family)